MHTHHESHEHPHDHPHDRFGGSHPGRRRGGRSGGRGGPRGRGPGGPGGPGRQRAARGAVASGVLLVLAENAPLHGYELINELESRSEGRWRPSPGSMYPSLGRLEEKGLIEGTDTEEGKRTYTLTEAGQERVTKRDPDAPLPWDESTTRSSTGLRPIIAEVGSATRQIARFGTTEQQEKAAAALTEAKAKLYAILAE